ncbi:unnamed protein product [Symbiodinium sp. KB8]|nr:unnamed protein product [Symbiodinium sp. KB8]
MKAALQGPSPPVSATAFTARLLREQLPLAPVTLHAASRAALEGAGGGIRQGQVLDNLRQQQELKGNLVGGFVRFQQPLSASPSLIHITATRPAWTLRLKELSERGMLVQISPLSPAGWKEDLQLAYCAGSAEGVQHIGPSKGIRTVQVHFIPRLTRTPELVALQTYIRQRQGAPSGPAPARPEPEAVLCQLGGFAIAASLPGDGDGLSLRAVRTGKVVEETSAQATLGRGKVALALAAPTAAGELEIKAQWEPTAETETKEAKAHEGEKPEVGDFLSMSRVKVARASLRGFAVLLHRDARMLQLWYEAVCSDATTSARALQALATLPEAEKDEEALRSKGLQALSLELPEPEMPWSPETPARSRGDGFTGFTTSQSGLSLPDSEGMSSQQMPGDRAAVWFLDDDMWHERLLLWPHDQESWWIYTPDHDVYSEQIGGDPQQGVWTFRVKGLDLQYWSRLRFPVYQIRDSIDDDTLKGLIKGVLKDLGKSGGSDEAALAAGEDEIPAPGGHDAPGRALAPFPASWRLIPMMFSRDNNWVRGELIDKSNFDSWRVDRLKLLTGARVDGADGPNDH